MTVANNINSTKNTGPHILTLSTLDHTVPAPLSLYKETIRAAWIDYNGHLNMAYYLLAFDHATDALLDQLGLGAEYAQTTDGTTFTLEAHISYLAEVGEGDVVRFETQVFDFDDKRIHYAHTMHHESKNYFAATNELLTLHVSQSKRRSTPMPGYALERLKMIKESHKDLPPPPGRSRQMGLTQNQR